ncbi:MAG: penicillin acylase family protein, partial [Psychrosphaera sp.]|nr:penicillin acylase family protein [Psychrosphaera sp.]
GKAGLDSRSAHVFREFAANFDRSAYLTTTFDVTDPANPPNTLAQDPEIMKTLAQAATNLTQAGFALDLTLGEIQFVEQTLPDNTGGPRLSWAGGTSAEGGFNVFSNYNKDNETLLPKHNYPTLIDTITGNPMRSDLTAQGYQVQRGSSWMYVLNFTDEGPVARGLLTSSQSAHWGSEFSSDQTRLYSNSVTLRPLYFSKRDIAANTIKTLDLSSR